MSDLRAVGGAMGWRSASKLSRWRGGAENLIPAIDRAIWVYGHPLRRQAQHLDLYRTLHAQEPKETPKVKARKR